MGSFSLKFHFALSFLLLLVSCIIMKPKLASSKLNFNQQKILKNANQAYENQSYYEAIIEYKKIALNSTQVMRKLSQIYSSKILGLINYEESFKWAKLAADRDDAQAIYYVGIYYLKGLGVNQNFFQAYKQFKKAYKLGNLDSAYEIALMYSQGMGLENDWKKAYQWSKLAADKGHRSSMVLLGEILYQGKGVKQDKSKGIQWILKSEGN